jgi:hypothetical protein
VVRTFREHRQQLLHEDMSVVARRLLSDIEYAAQKHPILYHAVHEGLMERFDCSRR